MPSKLITASLTPEDKAAALAAITTLRDKLPFLLDLSPDEIRALPKIGTKSRDFVERVLETVKLDPGFLGRDFDVEEFERDVVLYRDLLTIQIALSKLSGVIDDTVIAVGSDAYSGALEAYAYARASGQVEGIDELRAMMGRRFARSSPTPPSTDTTAA